MYLYLLIKRESIVFLGQLHPYLLQDSRTIEHAWQQHEEVQLVISGRHYLIDLQQLQQINEETNQARFIKRTVTPNMTDTTATTTIATDSIDESTNTNRQLTTTNNSSDARTEMMKDNIELYSSFIQSLFSVLYEVYNSLAGPAVKHRCLEALLLMIYYCPPDLFETILKQQSISSHIASMLASSDYKIVASALQMAEILMKKLPQIFSIYFYREDVVHQIEILIGFGVSSSSSSNISLARHNHTSGSRSQLDLVHLNDHNISTQNETLDEQLRNPTNTRRYYTITLETHPSTRIETRSQRARLPKTSRDGISACLEYIEFFSITSQNKSLAIVANCCIHILIRNDFNYIREHLENLSNRLRSDDKKTVEHVCTIFSRLVENFHRDSLILREIASMQLLKTMQTMLVIQPSLLNSITFVSIIHMFFIFSAYCPILAVTLLKMNIADTIIYLLTGTNENKSIIKSIPITYKSAALSTNEIISMNISSIQQTNNIELISRTPQELYEIVSLIGEMMPRLPSDDPLFQVDQLFRRSILSHRAYDATSNSYVLWHWQDDQGIDFSRK
ncbi:unnamed protein product [Rotaria sp. Silwood2]|nr:unnamed protein product [Rotaria sp. Silwood2]